MNRRAFLTTLGAALAGATLDPERLLWRPGVKTIFLPSGVTTLAETLYVPSNTFITQDTAMFWKNAIRMGDNVFRNMVESGPIGVTVTMRVPRTL